MNKGTIIMLCGLPGSGKTTLAKKLEIERRAIRLCPDEWILRLIPDQHDVPKDDIFRGPVEKLLFETAIKLANLDVTVILENGFWAVSERNEYRDEARRAGVAVELYYLEASFETLWERVAKRNEQLPAGTFHISEGWLKKWYQQFEPPTPEEGETYTNFQKYG